jgi:Tfp pilus assembly protein PilV
MGSVVVFMVGISALLGVYFASAKMAQRAEHAYAAFNIAKSHIEDLKSYSFGDLADANETRSIVDKNGVADLTAGLYVRSTTTTPSYNSDTNLTQITVNVWPFLTRYDLERFLAGTTNPTSTDITTVIYQNG